MSKYQVRIDVYFDEQVDADNLFKHIEGLKAKMIKFTNAGSDVVCSRVDLIENNHDGETFQPCNLLKNLSKKIEDETWNSLDNTK